MASKCYEGAHIRSLLAAAAVVIGRGGKRRAEIEASRVYVGRRAYVGSTLPTQGPRVRETDEFNPELRSLLDVFTTKQVTDRIRALHRA